MVGASFAVIASTQTLTWARVIAPKVRSPSCGRKCAFRTTLSRARLVARLAGLAVSHCSAQERNVTWPSAGSRHLPFCISACTRARNAEASALVANVWGAGRSWPCPSG